MTPSPETRRKAEDEAVLDAIALFKSRAQLLAEALGKSYTIHELSVGNSERVMPPMRMVNKALSLSSGGSPMPVEAGESQVTVTVSGKIAVE
jgi:Predicted periplasmic/secreted protein